MINARLHTDEHMCHADQPIPMLISKMCPLWNSGANGFFRMLGLYEKWSYTDNLNSQRAEDLRFFQRRSKTSAVLYGVVRCAKVFARCDAFPVYSCYHFPASSFVAAIHRLQNNQSCRATSVRLHREWQGLKSKFSKSSKKHYSRWKLHQLMPSPFHRRAA